VVGVLLAVFVAAGERFAQSVMHTGDTFLLLIGVLAAGPALVSALAYPFVIGSGSVRAATMVTFCQLAASLLAYAGLAVTGNLTVSSAVVVWFAVLLGEALTLGAIAWRVQAPGVSIGVRALLRRVWRYGLVVWLANVLGFAALRMDIYLLAYFEGAAAVGVYAVAVAFAELLRLIPNSIGGVMMPKVAAEGEDALALTLRMSRVTGVVVGVAAICMVAVAAPIIPPLFGAEFAGAALPLLLIAPGIVASSAAGMSASYLVGRGRPKFATIEAGVNVVVNLIANLLLIPRLGIAGAALASTLSYTVSAACPVYFLVRLTGVRVRDLLLPTRSDFVVLGDAARHALSRSGRGGSPESQA
jgi:O-antigen/teichoic acid export membrane protein